MLTKFKVDGTPKAGNLPCIRVCNGNDPQDKATAVAGLRGNFYDVEYLS